MKWEIWDYGVVNKTGQSLFIGEISAPNFVSASSIVRNNFNETICPYIFSDNESGFVDMRRNATN